jgi:Chaperone of endosialidase
LWINISIAFSSHLLIQTGYNFKYSACLSIISMKHFFILLWCFFLTCTTALMAQTVPQSFNYQSVVRNTNGTAYASQNVTLLFAIRSGSANGSIIYTERHVTSTNEFGLVNVAVGQGTALGNSFDAINWGGGPKYLSVSLETAPNVFDEIGATELLSVPFALYALNTANGGGGGSSDDWGNQTAQTDLSLKGNGTGGNPLGIAQQGAQVGQVLKWDGNKWTPQTDIATTNVTTGTVTQINTGTGIAGGPITTTGTLGLTNTGVTPGIYGSATEIPVISIDAQGRITSVFTQVPQPGTINMNGGAGIAVQQNGFSFTVTNTGDTNAGDDVTSVTQANGDVSGTFNNLQIKADVVGATEISPSAVGTTELADNSVSTAKLINDAVTTDKIANAAVTNAQLADNAVSTTKILNGAVTGAKIAQGGATNGQVLKWNGTAWSAAADNAGTLNLQSGTGINIAGNAPNLTIVNTGDTNPNDDLTSSSTANGDVTGPFSNLQIANNTVGTTQLVNGAVTGAKIAQGGATNGQVLKWNGTTWAPAADNTGTTTIIGGTGIDINVNGNNTTVVNTGDTDESDDITTTSTANGDISGVFSNLQIKPSAVNTAEIANGSITAPKLDQMGATNGQVLTWSNTADSWIPANAGSGGGNADNWGTQVAVTGAALTGNGTSGSPLNLAQQGATSGQTLKWNGTAWLPASDSWGTQNVSTNTTLSGNGTSGNLLGVAKQGATNGQVLTWIDVANSWVPQTISGGGAADNWGTQVAITGNTITGDGTVDSPLNIAQQDATNGQVLTWSNAAGGWIPATPPSGGAGDNWGTQVVSTGTTLTGNGTSASPLRIAQQGATNGQALKWNGTTWAPAADGGDNWGTQTVTTSTVLSGTGTAASPLTLAQQGATNGQVLAWNSTNNTWSPTAASAMGDNWGSQVVNTNLNFSGNGTSANPLRIAQQGAVFGQTLKWDGTKWAPANDIGGGTYTAGTGISLSGLAPNFTISNTGDLSNTNELQNLQLTGTQLKISGTNSAVSLDTILGTAGLNSWTRLNNKINNTDNTLVGINTNNPLTEVHIKGTDEILRVEGTNPIFGITTKTNNYEGYLQMKPNSLTLGTIDSSSIILQTNSTRPGMVVNGLTGRVTFGSATSSSQQVKVFHGEDGLGLENIANGQYWELWVTETGALSLYNTAFGPLAPAGTFSVLGGYSASSDRSLKKDIRPVSSVLDRFMQLEPVNYRFKTTADDSPLSTGLIAQDVQVLFPDLVSKSPVRHGAGGTLMVNYDGVYMLGVKAIQEQQLLIQALQQENQTLQARILAIEQALKEKK